VHQEYKKNEVGKIKWKLETKLGKAPGKISMEIAVNIELKGTADAIGLKGPWHWPADVLGKIITNPRQTAFHTQTDERLTCLLSVSIYLKGILCQTYSNLNSNTK